VALTFATMLLNNPPLAYLQRPFLLPAPEIMSRADGHTTSVVSSSNDLISEHMEERDDLFQNEHYRALEWLIKAHQSAQRGRKTSLAGIDRACSTG